MKRISSMYLLVAVITLTGFTTVGLGAIVFAQHGDPPANPFAAYADIFPGQPGSAVVARGLSCAANAHNYYQSEDYETCILDPTASAFSQIWVGISNGIIEQTDFVIQDQRLRVGDLTSILGANYRRNRSPLVAFYWRGRSTLAWINTDQMSPFSPVWKLTFTNMSVSVDE